MSKIIGATVGTPMNPQKVVEKTDLEKRVETIEKAKENGDFNGTDGKDGQNGVDGADGKSAYQYAQDGGYTGTEEEFAQKMAEENPTKEEFNKLSEEIADIKQNGTGTVEGLVEITSGEPTKEGTVLTVDPNAGEVSLYTAPEIDAMFDAFINAEEVSY